jgi:hypothetical protein
MHRFSSICFLISVLNSGQMRPFSGFADYKKDDVFFCAKISTSGRRMPFILMATMPVPTADLLSIMGGSHYGRKSLHRAPKMMPDHMIPAKNHTLLLIDGHSASVSGI